MLTLSLVWGILAAVGMIIAFFPCLGSLNWLNIPFSALGLIFSIVAVATSKQPQKGAGVAGIVLCALAMILGLIRLALGGGIL
ncbi:MAG: hypothetical protein NZR01_07200 [Bryobacteraceae bacterium]|nr:hypothetical protein [Bryobacteraceae bacterium]